MSVEILTAIENSILNLANKYKLLTEDSNITYESMKNYEAELQNLISRYNEITGIKNYSTSQQIEETLSQMVNSYNDLLTKIDEVGTSSNGGTTSNLTNEQLEAINLVIANKDNIENPINLNNKDLVSNYAFTSNPLLFPIFDFFRRCSLSNIDDFVYISTGDSTSSISYAKIQQHYTFLLTQLNCSYYDNSYPGQTTYDWLNNVDRNTIDLAVENSLGLDGENTIMEFSFGINDFDGVNTRDDIYNLLHASITNYLTLKPKATVFLSSTIKTSSTSRDTLLLDVYDSLCSDLGLYHFKRYDSTLDLYGNPLYYFDHLHPGKFGARAWMNDLFNNIVPFDLKKNIKLVEYDSSIIDTDFEYFYPTVLKRGYFSIVDPTKGDYKSDYNALCIDKFPVVAGDTLIFSHRGERKDIFMFDENGDYITYTKNADITNNTTTFLIPDGVFYISINITLKYNEYSSLFDVPTVHKDVNESLFYLPLRSINMTIKNSFDYDLTRDGITVDSYGRIGFYPQNLVLDSKSRMKWM